MMEEAEKEERRDERVNDDSNLSIIARTATMTEV